MTARTAATTRIPHSKTTSIGQKGWWRCKNCQGMFFKARRLEVFKTGGEHDGSASGDYRIHLTIDDWQAGLAGLQKVRRPGFRAAKNSQSKCPGKSRRVRTCGCSGSGHNYLPLARVRGRSGEAGWRWCEKCQSALDRGSRCQLRMPRGSSAFEVSQRRVRMIHNREADGAGPGGDGAVVVRDCGRAAVRSACPAGRRSLECEKQR